MKALDSGLELPSVISICSFLLITYIEIGYTPVDYQMKTRLPENADVLKGTLILLVPRTLDALGSLHASGRRQLARETKDWRRMSSTIDRFLGAIPNVLAEDLS